MESNIAYEAEYLAAEGLIQCGHHRNHQRVIREGVKRVGVKKAADVVVEKMVAQKSNSV
jgi:hypothetical protein